MTFEEANRAIKRSDLLRMRLELERGLDPNLSNKLAWTLLMCAAMLGNTSIGTLLLEHGADPERQNQFGDTALSLASHTGHPSFARLLLEHGASLEGFPFGKSFEDFLEWVEKYGSGSADAIKRTRSIVSAGRIGSLHPEE